MSEVRAHYPTSLIYRSVAFLRPKWEYISNSSFFCETLKSIFISRKKGVPSGKKFLPIKTWRKKMAAKYNEEKKDLSRTKKIASTKKKNVIKRFLYCEL